MMDNEMTLEEQRELVEQLSIKVATVCEIFHEFNGDMSRFMIEILKDIRSLREAAGLNEGDEDQ